MRSLSGVSFGRHAARLALLSAGLSPQRWTAGLLASVAVANVSVEAWTGPALPHPLQQEQRCVPATMISFWNALPGRRRRTCAPSSSWPWCLCGWRRLPRRSAGNPLPLGCRPSFQRVLRIGAPRPELLLAGTSPSRPQLVWRCWQAYSRYYHSHDPLFLRIQRQRAARCRCLATCWPRDIEFDAYREAIYRDNGLSEWLSSLALGRGRPAAAVQSLPAPRGRLFQRAQIAAFEQWVPALLHC